MLRLSDLNLKPNEGLQLPSAALTVVLFSHSGNPPQDAFSHLSALS